MGTLVPVIKIKTKLLKSTAGLMQKRVWVHDSTGRRGYYRDQWVKPYNGKAPKVQPGLWDLHAKTEEPKEVNNKSAPNKDPNIGRQWKSQYGTREVIGTHETGKYLIATNGDKAHAELISPKELDREIALDEDRYATKLKGDAKRQLMQEFLSNYGEVAKKSAINNLERQVNLGQGLISIQHIIENGIKNGFVPTYQLGGKVEKKGALSRVFVDKDWKGFKEEHLGKYAMDYAEFIYHKMKEEKR